MRASPSAAFSQLAPPLGPLASRLVAEDQEADGQLFDGRGLGPRVRGGFSRPLPQGPLQVATDPPEGTGLELARPLIGDAQALTHLLQG
jgi:hypothetical protein